MLQQFTNANSLLLLSSESLLSFRLYPKSSSTGNISSYSNTAFFEPSHQESVQVAYSKPVDLRDDRFCTLVLLMLTCVGESAMVLMVLMVEFSGLSHRRDHLLGEAQNH